MTLCNLHARGYFRAPSGFASSFRWQKIRDVRAFVSRYATPSAHNPCWQLAAEQQSAAVIHSVPGRAKLTPCKPPPPSARREQCYFHQLSRRQRDRHRESFCRHMGNPGEVLDYWKYRHAARRCTIHQSRSSRFPHAPHRSEFHAHAARFAAGPASRSALRSPSCAGS